MGEAGSAEGCWQTKEGRIGLWASGLPSPVLAVPCSLTGCRPRLGRRGGRKSWPEGALMLFWAFPRIKGYTGTICTYQFKHKLFLKPSFYKILCINESPYFCT